MSGPRLLATYAELGAYSALLWISDRFERICPAWSRYRERTRRAYLDYCELRSWEGAVGRMARVRYVCGHEEWTTAGQPCGYLLDGAAESYAAGLLCKRCREG